MNKAEETIFYKGHKIDIFYDEDYNDTPNDWDDSRLLIYDHRDFTIEVKGFDAQEIFEHWSSGHKTFPSGKRRYWLFPVYAYIHSGVSLSLSRGYDRWDTSFKGFMLIERNIRTCNTHDVAREQAEQTLKTWNEILTGQVYGYVVTDSEGNELDSCWGYIGDTDYPISEAKFAVNEQISRRVKAHMKRVKEWIRNKVPLINRKELSWA